MLDGHSQGFVSICHRLVPTGNLPNVGGWRWLQFEFVLICDNDDDSTVVPKEKIGWMQGSLNQSGHEEDDTGMTEHTND